MAIGVMEHYTGKILWRSPDNIAGIQTFVVDGASELRAGYVCTSTGHTFPDVGKLDADDDVTLGVCLDHPAIDMATDFADNKVIQVALRRAGAGVWIFLDDDEGALVAATAVYSTGVDDDGFCEKLDAIDVDTAFSESGLQGQFDILTNAAARYVGILVQDEADQGSTDVPAKVLLV